MLYRSAAEVPSLPAPPAYPAVVLEPGLGASSIGWSQVRAGAAGLTEVISYDRAGLGAAPPLPGPRGLAALADGLAEVVVGCGRPAVLVGHSLGATIARQLAATRPELVAGLLLIDPIPEKWVLRHGRWALPFGVLSYRAMELLARSGLMDMAMALPVLRGVTRSSTSPLAAFSATERDALAAEMRNPVSHRTAGREFTGLLRSRPALRALADNPTSPVPLTVISAGRTQPFFGWLRRDATAWHARLVAATPGARHLVIADAGHFLPRYQPAIVTAAIAELLARATSPNVEMPGIRPNV